jgi:hypothetical protein
MKKHIAGFVLFSFILVSAAFIAKIARNLFRQSEATYVKLVKAYLQTKYGIKETEAKTGKVDKNSPRVTQAFFNLTTKQVNLELLFKNMPDFDDDNRLVLKFNYFRNNGKGVSFIHSETVRLLPESVSVSYEGGKSSASIVGSYEWLDNLGSYESIYVSAEIADSYSSNNTIPNFDADFAKEIVLFSGKFSRMQIVGGRNIEK